MVELAATQNRKSLIGLIDLNTKLDISENIIYKHLPKLKPVNYLVIT